VRGPGILWLTCNSKLNSAYTVHLWLVVKRVVDFLLVLVELVSLAFTEEAL